MFKKAVLIILILAVMQGCGATQYKKKMFGKYKVYKKEMYILRIHFCAPNSKHSRQTH